MVPWKPRKWMVAATHRCDRAFNGIGAPEKLHLRDEATEDDWRSTRPSHEIADVRDRVSTRVPEEAQSAVGDAKHA